LWCAVSVPQQASAQAVAGQGAQQAAQAPKTDAGAPPAVEPAGDKPGPLRRLYDWTIRWAQTPYALWALILLAFAEASFFPIPPDVLLIAMAMGTPSKALAYAAVCTVGSVAGGCLGYVIGVSLFDTVGKRILSFYGYQDQFEHISTGFAKRGFLWIFIAALTPIPYKVFTIAAGVCHRHVTIRTLLAASVVGRGLRFFAVGALFALFGPHIKGFIDRYFSILTVALVVVAVLGFAAVKLLTGTKARAEPAPGAGPPDRPAAEVPDSSSHSDIVEP
jgi:membrane protein YqaA with SNARE-associated domain